MPVASPNFDARTGSTIVSVRKIGANWYVGLTPLTKSSNDGVPAMLKFWSTGNSSVSCTSVPGACAPGFEPTSTLSSAYVQYGAPAGLTRTWKASSFGEPQMP